MADINPQFIKAEGGELVVLTRGEFDSLMARAAEADEDADDAAVYAARKADLEAGVDARLPAEVSAFMLRGDTLLRAVRKWRDMTQVHLSHRTDLSQGFISDLESGRRTGTRETLELIARALDVDPRWLRPLEKTNE